MQLGKAALDICMRYRKKAVVGLDFSGPPVNTFGDFYDIFKEAQDEGKTINN